jgi:hypothetical protein
VGDVQITMLGSRAHEVVGAIPLGDPGGGPVPAPDEIIYLRGCAGSTTSGCAMAPTRSSARRAVKLVEEGSQRRSEARPRALGGDGSGVGHLGEVDGRRRRRRTGSDRRGRRCRP